MMSRDTRQKSQRRRKKDIQRKCNKMKGRGNCKISLITNTRDRNEGEKIIITLILPLEFSSCLSSSSERRKEG